MEKYIHRENLITALRIAIDTQATYEKVALNYKIDSALVAGWREVLENLKNGETVKIK
jgi:hypothetical protein